jgi:hypothetical protein
LNSWNVEASTGDYGYYETDDPSLDDRLTENGRDDEISRADVPCRTIPGTDKYKCDCDDDYVNGNVPLESEVAGFDSCDSPAMLAKCGFSGYLQKGCIKSCGLNKACK